MEDLVPVIDFGQEQRTAFQFGIKLFFQIALYFFRNIITEEPEQEPFGQKGWYGARVFQTFKGFTRTVNYPPGFAWPPLP